MASNAGFTEELLRREELGPYNSRAFLELPGSDFNAKREIVDAWGTPFRLSDLGTNQIIIHSAGADKEWDTQDDIYEPIYP